MKKTATLIFTLFFLTNFVNGQITNKKQKESIKNALSIDIKDVALEIKKHTILKTQQKKKLLKTATKNYIKFLNTWQKGLLLEELDIILAQQKYHKAKRAKLIERSTKEVYFSMARILFLEKKIDTAINLLNEYIQFAEYRIERADKLQGNIFALDQERKKIFQEKVKISKKLVKLYSY